MAKTFNITLNIDKTKRQPAAIAARVGDVDSIIVNATLVSGTSSYTPSGSAAYFECVCPNGYSVRQQASLSSNVVTVTLAPEVFQVAGVINDAYFRFEAGSPDNPTYVESTESFVILVYSSIDDNVDAGDYIAEWRQSQAALEAAADEAEIALPTIQSAVNSVASASTSAISSINQAKQDVEDAATDVMTPINNAIDDMNETMTEAINEFKSDCQSEISAFDTNAANKIQQFETNATNKLSAYDSDVDTFIDTAQQTVDQNVTALKDATQDALDAMESALSGDAYGDLLQRISRDWKLTLQDMVVLKGTIDLDVVSTGTFALDPGQVSVSNAPVTGNKPFILFSGQYFKTMKYQLIVYPAESIPLYIRYNQGTASGDSVTWGSWSTWNSIAGGGSSITTPVSIENGGTGSTTAGAARTALGITPANIGAAPSDHKHSAVDVTSGTLSIQRGGTGASTAEAARTALGITPTAIGAASSTHKHSASDITSGALSITFGGTGATTAAQARANIGAGTSSFSGSYNDLTDKPTIPTVPSLPLTLANGGTGAVTASAARTNLDVYSKSEVDAKVGSGGGSTSGLIEMYTNEELHFTIPNRPQYSPIIYNGSTLPFSGFVMNGTYKIVDNCLIFAVSFIRKTISQTGYPYLYLDSSTMDNTSSTATFDSSHGFNFFVNTANGQISGAHSFPFCPEGRDFWNCGFMIGRISSSTPSTTSPAITAEQVMIPFSLRFTTDGWCKMLLSVPANMYINKYISIDHIIVPPINLGVGGNELS